MKVAEKAETTCGNLLAELMTKEAEQYPKRFRLPQWASYLDRDLELIRSLCYASFVWAFGMGGTSLYQSGLCMFNSERAKPRMAPNLKNTVYMDDRCEDGLFMLQYGMSDPAHLRRYYEIQAGECLKTVVRQISSREAVGICSLHVHNTISIGNDINSYIARAERIWRPVESINTAVHIL